MDPEEQSETGRHLRCFMGALKVMLVDTRQDATGLVCRVCFTYYADVPENFYRKSKGKGFQATCRACWQVQNRVNFKKYYAENRDALREQAKRFEQENPDWVRAKKNRRRARLRNAEGSHTREDIQKQYEAQKGCCHWCDEPVGKKYHVDHVIPLSRGGSNGPENLVIACPTCNSAKGTKMPSEFVGVLS